jgi:hypothetical protein
LAACSGATPASGGAIFHDPAVLVALCGAGVANFRASVADRLGLRQAVCDALRTDAADAGADMTQLDAFIKFALALIEAFCGAENAKPVTLGCLPNRIGVPLTWICHN